MVRNGWLERRLLPNIRIVLVELRGIERDIVLEALRDQDGMRVVGEVRDRARVSAAISLLDPDLLIWHLDAVELPEASPGLLFAHPTLRVLVLDREGIGFVWSLHPHKDHLGELSPSHLVRSIKAQFANPEPAFERYPEPC
jgi:hypothetical protein